MAKEIEFHLDECFTCVHNKVCKHIENIDKLVKKSDLPLILNGASCKEFVPDDPIYDTIKDPIGEGEAEYTSLTEPEEGSVTQTMVSSVAGIPPGYKVTKVMMDTVMYGELMAETGLDEPKSFINPFNGQQIPIEINDAFADMVMVEMEKEDE